MLVYLESLKMYNEFKQKMVKKMKFKYFNDTKRDVSIHPATYEYGCKSDKEVICPLEICTFHLPENTYPWVKMWDYGEEGLSILVIPEKND